MTATVHISPRSEAIRPFVQRSYTLPRLFFFHTLSTYIYVHIACVVQFQRRRLASIQPMDFPPLLVRPIPPPLFSFFLHPLLPSLSAVQSVRFRDARTELCAAKTNWKYLAPRNTGNGSTNIYLCVCVRSRGDNGISGRGGSLLNIRPLGVLYTYGSLGTGYQMARGVASVTLPITNLEIAVPLSAMNWFTRARLVADQFRFLHFFLSLLFGFSFPLSGGMASLSILSSIYLIFDSVFLKIIRRIIYIPLLTSTKWVLLRGSLGNNKGKAWRSLRRPIRRIKREMWHSFGSFWKERKGWKVGTAINIVVQYNAALENSGRVKGVGRKSA